MKNKIILFCFLSLTAIALNSCEEKFKYKNSPNAVTTLVASDVLQVSANISGTVNTDNNSYITERGVCYSTDNNPTTSDSRTPDKNPGLGNFSCNIKNLLPSTTYYARAYANNSFGTAYGDVVIFTTQVATIPILSSTVAVNLITQVSARSGGVITNSGASNVTSRGVCWSSTSSAPTISDSKTSDGAGIGTYISSLTSLSPNITYNIRAYATNSVGTAYGDVKIFTTTSSTIPVLSSTTDATLITLTSASSGGTITSDGGASITSRGVCWSTTVTSPTVADSKTNDGSGIGTFTSSLTGLLSRTRYYLRSYATNSVGTAYGVGITFNTLSPSLPSISVITTSAVTYTTASSGGSISSDGGAAITSRGVCWSSITTNPTIANSRTMDGSGLGSFSSSLNGLLPNTTYYISAYATNSTGTAYSSSTSFQTTATSIPVISTTTTISAIKDDSALSGGAISSDGGSVVTSKGVCWSNTTSSPTISNSRTNDGSGNGTFSSTMTGLSGNTTYYVRAYATNNVGTAYGSLRTFITLSPPPILGQSYQGGIVAYIFQSGDSGYISGETHGLIVSSSNQSSGALWGCSGTSISGAANTAIGTGLSNTSAIVSGCFSSNIAATLCFNLSSGGFSDWYLPSRDELNKLYLNKSVIGGFASYYYWSSSQSSSTSSLCLDFSSGSLIIVSKNNSFYVRAIRKF